jgi:signal transduction histidine kinase
MALALPARWRVLGRVLGVLVAPLVVLALLGPVRAHQPGTTYASVSPAAGILGLAAALLLVLAAGVLGRPAGGLRPGLLTAAAGLAWLAPDAVGWEAGPAAIRSLGELARPLLPAILLHLAAGQLRRRWLDRATALAYLVLGGISVLRATVREPLLDPHCWSNCTDNVFLLRATPRLADVLGTALVAAWATAAAVTLAAVVPRLARTGRVHRPYLAALGLAGGGELVYALLLLARPEAAGDQIFVDVYVGRAALWVAVALAALWPTVQAARGRVRLLRVAADLHDAPRPGALTSTLAARLGDPDLAVVYPLDEPGQFVDGRGARVPRPRPVPGRSVSALARGGRTIALIAHDTDAVPPEMLDEMLGSASRLSVENERLSAQLQAQVHDLQDSRARIVASGDAARRQIERDLHDGAQQSLLAVTYELRVARASPIARGDRELVTVIDAALDETSLALDELRDLAHGIHPAVLTEAGLTVALRSLADGAAIPVELAELPGGRLAEGVELAIFALVTDVVGQAGARADDVVTLAVRRTGEVVEIDATAADVIVTDEVVDRIGALGGSVTVTGSGIRAVIPCA